MIFQETQLKGVFQVTLEKQVDERGFFARTWCQREWEAHGLTSRLVQCNVSFNHKKGTLRGLHYQIHPYGEAKLIRCIAGAIYDVIVDLRPSSPTFKEYAALTLTPYDYTMVYISEGFAHGFQTLEDNTEVFYQMSQFYMPEASRGVRWNDPGFGIKWPFLPSVISARDNNYPDFNF